MICRKLPQGTVSLSASIPVASAAIPVACTVVEDNSCTWRSLVTHPELQVEMAAFALELSR